MRGFFALIVVVAFAVAIAAGVRPATAASSCDDPPSTGAMECCDDAPAAIGCQAGDCAGMGAGLAVAVPEHDYSARAPVSPSTRVEPLVAHAAPAPDTAPPKSVV